jgi:hypothetical protein
LQGRRRSWASRPYTMFSFRLRSVLPYLLSCGVVPPWRMPSCEFLCDGHAAYRAGRLTRVILCPDRGRLSVCQLASLSRKAVGPGLFQTSREPTAHAQSFHRHTPASSDRSWTSTWTMPSRARDSTSLVRNSRMERAPVRHARSVSAHEGQGDSDRLCGVFRLQLPRKGIPLLRSRSSGREMPAMYQGSDGVHAKRGRCGPYRVARGTSQG